MDKMLTVVVQDYLVGDDSLDRLQRLLIDLIWDRRDEIPQDVFELAKQLELSIAEFTSGDISVDQLKMQLRQAVGLSSYVLNAGQTLSGAASPQWRSSAQTERVRRAVFW